VHRVTNTKIQYRFNYRSKITINLLEKKVSLCRLFDNSRFSAWIQARPIQLHTRVLEGQFQMEHFFLREELQIQMIYYGVSKDKPRHESLRLMVKKHHAREIFFLASVNEETYYLISSFLLQVHLIRK
jgi:hypothetical protein